MQQENLYHKYLDGRHRENHPTMYAEYFVDFLKHNLFDTLIVDVWCWDGRDVNVFKKSWFDVLGIDYSEKEITIARGKFPNLMFEIQNVENLLLPDNSVGAFFMINVIHYVDNQKAIQEICRTLTSKGYFFVHFNIDIVDQYWNVDYHHDYQSILQLLSGFKILHQRVFERIDYKPIKHTHTIIEFILQK